MNSRRRFLKIGGLAVAAGFIFGGKNIFSQTTGSGDYFPAPLDTLASAASLLNYEAFEPLINTSFEIKAKSSIERIGKSAANKSLRLVEVVKHTYNENRQSRVFSTGFSLIFEIEGKGKLADKIYEISHPQAGEFPIFISNVGRSGRRYQSVFNRAAV